MIIRFADHVVIDETRFSKEDHIELQNQMNCNCFDTESNGETWFDEDIPCGHVTIIDEFELFDRYFRS